MNSKLSTYAAALALIAAILLISDGVNTGSDIADGLLGGLASTLTVLLTRAATIAAIREERVKVRS